MTHPLSNELFKSVSFTKAFRAALKNPSHKVIYNGKSWKVGEQEFTISKSRLNCIRTYFLKMSHKFKIHCFSQYKKDYFKCFRRFEKAKSVTWPKEVIKTERAAHEVINTYNRAKETPIKVGQKIKEITECRNEIIEERAAQEKSLMESEEMQDLLKSTKTLESLSNSLDLYIKMRMDIVAKQNPDILEAIGKSINNSIQDMKNFFGVKDEEVEKPKEEEIKLTPEEMELATQILDPLPLNPDNPKDSLPFMQEIERMIHDNNAKSKQIMARVDTSLLEGKLHALERELEHLKRQQMEAPKVMASIAQNYNNPELFPSVSQTPVKTASKESAVKTVKTKQVEQSPLKETTKQFLAELKKLTSTRMAELWESLLTNLAEKHKEDMVVSFTKSGNKIELKLKDTLKLYMLPCNSKGIEDPRKEPEGGSILVFGSPTVHKMTFSAEVRNNLSITGLSTWARIPKRIADVVPGWVLSIVGEYAQAELPSMEIHQDTLTINAHKKVKLFTFKDKRDSSITALKKHWRENGCLVKGSEEDFLKKKRAALIKDNKIII